MSVDLRLPGRRSGGADDHPEPPSGGATSWQPGLDGLRALAVAAVIAYHLSERLSPGGFIGVSVFFTVSGYLITSLLLTESERSGGIDLRRFWVRRFRRLWPLAWMTLLGVAVVALTGVWGADSTARLPAEIVAALAQIANWWQIGHGGYLQSFSAPSPLRHFWSLAIEEQFYLVWPLLLTFGLSKRRRAPSATVPLMIALGFAASTAIGFVLHDPDAIYLSTPTRAAELLAGAALAWIWRHRHLTGPTTGPVRTTVLIWGAFGSAVLVWITVGVSATAPIWSHGGFPAVSVASVGVVAASVTCSPANRVLGSRPLSYVGKRSYAMYLIHWPVIVALPLTWSLPTRAAITVAVTVLGADLVHRLIEQPIRVKAISLSRLAVPGMAVVAVALSCSILAQPEPKAMIESQLAATLEAAPDPDVPTSLAPATGDEDPATEVEAAVLEAPEPAPTTSQCIPPPSANGSNLAPTGSVEQFDPNTVQDIVDPTLDPCVRQLRVLVVGDSTARGIANTLRRHDGEQIALWDRSQLGCSLNEAPKCAPWREAWAKAVGEINPDVVVVSSRGVDDLSGVDDPPYLSPEADATRTAVLTEAMNTLGSGGARVLWGTAAELQLPNGLFYCNGERVNSQCNPEWNHRWNEAITRAAQQTSSIVIDLAGWTSTRPVGDRPDGLHLNGPALDDLATWLLPRIVASAPSR